MAFTYEGPIGEGLFGSTSMSCFLAVRMSTRFVPSGTDRGPHFLARAIFRNTSSNLLGLTRGITLSVTTDQRLQFSVGSGSGLVVFATPTVVRPPGSICFCVGTHDGTNLRWYVNGQLEVTIACAGFTPSSAALGDRIQVGDPLGTFGVEFLSFGFAPLVYSQSQVTDATQQFFLSGSLGKTEVPQLTYALNTYPNLRDIPETWVATVGAPNLTRTGAKGAYFIEESILTTLA